MTTRTGTAVGTSVAQEAVAEGMASLAPGLDLAVGAGAVHPANSAPTMISAAVVFFIGQLLAAGGFGSALFTGRGSQQDRHIQEE